MGTGAPGGSQRRASEDRLPLPCSPDQPNRSGFHLPEDKRFGSCSGSVWSSLPPSERVSVFAAASPKVQGKCGPCRTHLSTFHLLPVFSQEALTFPFPLLPKVIFQSASVAHSIPTSQTRISKDLTEKEGLKKKKKQLSPWHSLKMVPPVKKKRRNERKAQDIRKKMLFFCVVNC